MSGPLFLVFARLLFCLGPNRFQLGEDRLPNSAQQPTDHQGDPSPLEYKFPMHSGQDAGRQCHKCRQRTDEKGHYPSHRLASFGFTGGSEVRFENGDTRRRRLFWKKDRQDRCDNSRNKHACLPLDAIHSLPSSTKSGSKFTAVRRLCAVARGAFPGSLQFLHSGLLPRSLSLKDRTKEPGNQSALNYTESVRPVQPLFRYFLNFS
jgi:hypothetical protein